MYKSRLISLIKILDKKELRELDDFVNSPFFNKSVNCIKLFNYISSESPDFESPKLSKENTLKSLYQTQSKQSLGVDMTRLTRLIEEFLSIKQLGVIPFGHKLHEKKRGKINERALFKKYVLMDVLIHRGEFDYYNYIWKQSKKQLDGIQEKYLDVYLYQQLLTQTQHTYFHLQGDRNRFVSKLNENIVAHNEYLILSLLQTTCQALNFQQLDKGQQDLNPAEILLPALKDQLSHYRQIPLIDLYYFAWLLFVEPEEEEHFEALSSKLSNYQDQVDNRELVKLYTLATNYCNKQLRKGRMDYLSQLLSLFKNMVKEELIFSANIIPVRRFMNIVTVAIRSKDFIWAQYFIDEYVGRVPKKQQANVNYMSRALLAFYQKDYHLVLDYLFKSDIKDTLMNINQKVLLLKTYYELDDGLAFFNFSDTFKKFISVNKKINSTQQKPYKLLVGFTVHLYRIKNYFNEKKLLQLEKKIRTSPVDNKSWLLEKVNQLKQAH